MTRAILIPFHKYTPFGDKFYQPLLDFFLKSMKKYQDEYDKIYLLDSTWSIAWTPELREAKVEVIKVNPSLRYYDAYKEVLPMVKEDLVLFLDDDMVIYKRGVIDKAFNLIHCIDEDDHQDQPCDVVTIIDQIGEYETDKLKNGNKFCPYFFATRKELLMKYLDVDWGPDMPYCETLGHLTESMLNDGVKVYEFEEDKSGIIFDGSEQYPEQHTEGGKGYYHVRAGSTMAYLLATKKHGDMKTYEDYLKNQPKSEILRHCAWYSYMGGIPDTILTDLGITVDDWDKYYMKFTEYHGLI